LCGDETTKKNGNLGDPEKSNLIKLKICDKDFRKKTSFPPRDSVFFSRDLFLKKMQISAANCTPFMGHGIVTVIFLGTALRSGDSCQQKQKQKSQDKIHLLRKNKPTSGQRNQSDPRTKYLVKSVRKPKEMETCDKSGVFWRRSVEWGPRL